MTELKRLIKDAFECIGFEEMCNNHSEFLERIKSTAESLSEEYSVSSRNTDSSADNTLDEQLHSDEELVSKIEYLVKDLLQFKHGPFKSYTVFRDNLQELFQTHRNTDSKPVIKQVDKYSDRGETESRIAFKNSLRHHVGKLVTADQELDQIIENIVEFFLDTVNPVFRALNDSDEQSIIK